MFNQLLRSISRYFGISKMEANGLFILFVLMIPIIFSPIIYRKIIYSEGYSSFREDSIKLDSLLLTIALSEDLDTRKTDDKEILRNTTFVFNPNTISFDEMLLLNIDTVIARRIVKYRNNNGRFTVKPDLLKIYDFPEELYAKLVNYISIPEENKTKEIIPPKSKKSAVYSEVVKTKLQLDINKADTNELKKVKGIGKILSSRIIKYKKLLGGYINIDQLEEVYGLRDNSLKNLKQSVYIDSLFIPRKIRINFADWRELTNHPYINSSFANSIIGIRSKIGFLENFDDLNYLQDEYDSLLNMIKPYLEY